MDIPLIAGAYAGYSADINSQECINLIPVFDKEANKWAIYGRPGLKTVTNSEIYAANPVRGMIEMGGNLWVVVGNRIYKRSSGGTNTNKGTLDTSSGPVVFAKGDGSKLCFVDGTSGYTIVSDTFAKITDPDFPFIAAPTHVCYIDGYYIVNKGTTGDFHISALDDPTSWGALDYATAEGNPDDLQSLYNNQNNLWLLGKDSYEIWFDSGNATFPFERITGAIGHIGTSSPYSGAIFNRELFFLDKYCIVRRAKGLDPEKVSTPQIEYQIQQYTDITDAVGYFVPYEGHVFYVLTFPTANKTWVYDITSGMWHKWQSTTFEFRGMCYCYFNYQHIIGDTSNGKIYELDNATYKDDTADITKTIITRSVENDGRYVLHRNLAIDFEPGHGESIWTLTWSDDGTHSWSTGSSRTLANAVYTTKAIWNRLGQSKHRIYKLTSTSNAKTAINGMAHGDLVATRRR